MPTSANAELAVFEQVVMEALASRGLRCVPKVGVGGYRVDIGIAHPQDAGRFVLGVECDGPTYYGAPAVRDRELGRRKALERMGWQLHRTWSAAWHRDPEAEARRIIERYEALVAPKA